MRKTSALNWLVYITCVCLIGLTVLVTFWLTWPYKVIQYNVNPIPVLTEKPADVSKFDPNVSRPMAVFKPGQNIILFHDYCRLIDAPLTANVELINSVKLPLPYQANPSAVGCQRRVSTIIKVPDFYTSEEPVSIHFTLRYQVNPIRTVVYHLNTEYFLVKE
jgi:hypothetical protein